LAEAASDHSFETEPAAAVSVYSLSLGFSAGSLDFSVRALLFGGKGYFVLHG